MPPVRQPVVLESKNFGGTNTALQFSQIPPNQSPRMKNAWMPKIGAIGKRPGSKPVTTSALAAAIEYLTVYRTTTTEDILATSGTTLYKFSGTNALTAQTMTNALNRAGIYAVAFTDKAGSSILFITDGASMKQYNVTAVANITPAANDASPNPPNDMVNINALGPAYCWVYSGHVFVALGQSDIVYYSKRFKYDYFPSVQFERWVRENDYINGIGVAFNNVCLIPMRRGWGILTGAVFDDGTVTNGFKGNQFLNTTAGCIAPRSIQRVTYPTGSQTIVYLSDDGIYEIFETSIQDTGSRQYSTRNLFRDKIDFEALGLTEAEKTAAVGFFDAQYSLYFLSFKKATTAYMYVYDTRNGEWYTDWTSTWTGFQASAFVRKGGLYFAGGLKHLQRFDTDLYSDWEDSGQVTGHPVYFQRYSPLLSFEFSGFDSMWDYYLVEARQFLVPSTLDLRVIFTNDSSTQSVQSAWKNNVAVYGVSSYAEAAYANLEYTDIVNAPDRIIFHEKAKYIQILWENPRNEPTELYKDRFTGRMSIKG